LTDLNHIEVGQNLRLPDLETTSIAANFGAEGVPPDHGQLMKEDRR
jgi:hypothetical protein